MKKDKVSHKTRIYIVFSVVVLIVISIACFCIHSAYRKGVSDGRADYEKEAAELLSTLGNAISEKTEFNKNASLVLKDVPAEIEEEGINTYINNLTTLENSTRTESAKKLLSSFIEKWRSFKDVYASEDNSTITDAFNELKTSSATLTEKIREAYDDQISTALRSLSSN